MCCINKCCFVRAYILSFLHSFPSYPNAIQTVVTGVIFVIAAVILLLLQMEHETQSGGPDAHCAIPRAVAGPSGVRIMERRPNSEPDTPCPPPLIRRVQPGDLPPACLERGRSLTYRMMTSWDGLRYPAFNSYGSRLRSFEREAGLARSVVRALSLRRVYSILVRTYAFHCLTTYLLHNHSFYISLSSHYRTCR